MTAIVPNEQDSTAAALKRAVVYLRVSTNAQAETARGEEGFSIPAQREACWRKAGTLGAEVIGEFVDKGESARSAARPALQRMLDAVQTGGIDYVIVHKLNRLARNRLDDLQINLQIQMAGAKLISVVENIDESPTGILLHGIVATINQFESANLGTEALKGMTQKALQGGTPTRVPLGYLNVREMVRGREIRTVAIDPERAPLIRWAFDAYASGNFTVSTLTAALAEKGLTTRPGPKRTQHAVGRSDVAKILANRYYVGIVRFRGIEYSGEHPTLVDTVTFAKVQAILGSRRQGEKQRQHPHYLKGTIFCGRCGSRLCFTRSRGQGGLYDYFFCLGRQQHRTECDLPFLPVDEVEAAIERHYATIRLTKPRAARLRELFSAALTKRSAQARADAERQRKRLLKLRRDREKLLEAHLADAIPLDLLRSKQAQISQEMADAEGSLNAAQAAEDTIQGNLERALTMASNCQHAYRDASHTARRHWNQAFFDEIRIDVDGIPYHRLADPFALLTAADLPAELEAELKNPDLLSGQGSKETTLVGVRGLEPLTSAV